MPRNTIEAYGDIVHALFIGHQEGAFPRSELMDQFLIELNVLQEETRIAHLKGMLGLGFIIRVNMGNAYKQATYKLGPKGLEVAKRLISEKID